MDSPTRTQSDSERQLTAVRAWGEVTAAARFHGWPTGPVRMDSPASGARPTALPTATQVLKAGQDTPINDAEVALTTWEDQSVPPSVVVRMTPWPVRVPVPVLAVVPTATHQVPLTPAGTVVVVEVGGGGVVVVDPGTDVVVDPGTVVVVDPGTDVVVDPGTVVVVDPGTDVVVDPGTDVVVDVEGGPVCPAVPRAHTMSLR